MPDSALFFRLLTIEDKANSLCTSISSIREGQLAPSLTFAVSPNIFGRVSGSPFAYWAIPRIFQLFETLEPLEAEGRVARRTNGTTDDQRWIRAWWEVDPAKVGRTKGWVPHAKGGAYSPYYSDLHLLIAWDDSGQTYPGYQGTEHRPDLRPASLTYFFRPGATWPRRTNGLSFRALPAASIFGDKGPAVFSNTDAEEELAFILGVANSRLFKYMVELQLARVDLAQSYEAGIIQNTPFPSLINSAVQDLVNKIIELRRQMDSSNELSHLFSSDILMISGRTSLRDCAQGHFDWLAENERKVSDYQQQIDSLVFSLYAISEQDQQAIIETPTSSKIPNPVLENEDDEPQGTDIALEPRNLVFGLLSYLLGAAEGLWDIRFSLTSLPAPKFASPFAPLPACPPGMLVGPNGLPARSGNIVSEEWIRARTDCITPPRPGSVSQLTIDDSEYPIRIAWDGIVVDDPDHNDDIVERIRSVMELWRGEKADAIEQEACQMLRVKNLREYFRNPKLFFEEHIRRYSRSRRKAPIYWLLQSTKRSYGLWIYYHRLDRDLLSKAMVSYVEPKVRLEEERFNELQTKRQAAGTGGSVVKQLERSIDRQQALVAELVDFREKLERAVKLDLTPDLDDGVVLNIAPLHELVPWKVARDYWQELLAGKYEWSSIGKQLRLKGLVG